MFDTMMIGKKIKQARINQNMTQMNLADAMGVSYQAVSNWERGNAMPDISKLADLCSALHITVDELLGIASSAVTKAMAQEDLTVEDAVEAAVRYYNYFPNEPEMLVYAAPALPPKTVMEQSRKKSQRLDLNRIADMAPFLDEEFLDELIAHAEICDLDGLDELAPFLSQKTLENLVERANVHDLDVAVEIAPFLSKSALDVIVKRCIETEELESIEELAPFLSKETLNSIADAVITGNLDVDMEELYPFFGKETIRKLAKHMLEIQNLDALEEIVPFI